MGQLAGFDHVAITANDLEAFCAFYGRLFGMHLHREIKQDGKVLVRQIIIGGGVKLSVHQAGNGISLVARKPTPGSADFCMSWSEPIASAIELLKREGISIVNGPSPKRTREGLDAQSVYFIDPDGNLVELMATD
jgi:catechol 2,3-dioxygenase-like lactoylglutathione lyase family enzyme